MFWLRIAAISLAITLSACGGGGGGGSDGNPTPPVVSLDVSPGAIQAGTSATLNWDSTDTTDCTASGGWSGSRAGSGSESTGVLASTTSYTLTCNGPGGSDTRSATVTVTALPPAPVVSLSATPSTIASGAASTLNWSASNATSCTASGGWSGSKAVAGSQSTGSLGSTTSFTLTCTGAGGTGNQSVSVAVIPPPPVVTLTASPQTIDSGQAATLTWTSANAATCTASGSWNGSRATSGSLGTGPLTGNASYTLTCNGPGGSAAQTVAVTVNPAVGTPTVNLSANPSNVQFGSASTLSWTTTNATACSASGGWSGSRGTSGSESTGGLSANTSYSLTCTGPGGSANQAISVTVTPPAPTVTLSASPTSLASGASSTLTWTTTNATSCTASGGWSGTKATSGTASTGAVTATTTYSLTCSGAGGSANQSATVTVNPAPTVTLSASPTSLASGASSTLTWSTTNATSCTASGGWNGTKTTSGTVSTGAVTATTTYTLTCTGAGGSANQSATVTVNPAPTVTLSASPTSLASGASSTLTWATTNATSCTASGGWSGTKTTSGTVSTGAVTATTTYTLTCTGAGGSANQSATVTVNPAPTVTLSASPTSLASGASSTLTWSTTNATSCTASGGWSGTKTTSGTVSTGAVTSTTTYTLTCTGAGGSANQSATVTVTTPAPTVTLSANPTSVSSGGTSTLTWSTANATSCTASGGWSGSKATSGTASTAAVSATTTYTLTCAGPGGSGSDSATVIVTGSNSVFPVRVESNKRYLIDAQGAPFLIHGDTPWCLITQLTREQVDQYLEDRRVKGFNTIMVELIEKRYSANPPFNVYGDAPFTTAGDFSTPNAAYFDHAAYVIAKAREKGMLVLLTPAYLGFGGGPDGWYDELGASSTAVLEGYGQYVATRFQAYDNILWVHGGDYNPADRDPMRDIINGILSVETTRLHTFHGSRGTAALEWLGPSETWLDVNDIYTTTETVIAEAQGEFDRSTMPYFLIEAGYENESATGTQTRQQAWQAVLSGATGQLMGQQSIWKFDPIWPTRLNTEGASTLIHLRTLLESYAWWTLVPDFGNTFLTGGIGTAGLRAPAAVASDGSFALVYVREVRQLTVDMGAIAGSLVQARWYDPTNGSFTAVSGSPFASSGSRNFTPAGTNALGKTDWVLVLDSIP